MTYGCQTEAIPDVTTVPSVSGLNILDSLDIKYQWLFTANAKECPCSDCREAREISSMERLYPDGRLFVPTPEETDALIVDSMDPEESLEDVE